MRLYVSGPMTGIHDHNFPAFAAAAKELEAAGHVAIDPGAKGVIDGWSWEDYLRHDLRQVFDCDGVALLPGWVDSRGAWLEVTVARALSMPIRTVEEWCA